MESMPGNKISTEWEKCLFIYSFKIFANTLEWSSKKDCAIFDFRLQRMRLPITRHSPSDGSYLTFHTLTPRCGVEGRTATVSFEWSFPQLSSVQVCVWLSSSQVMCGTSWAYGKVKSVLSGRMPLIKSLLASFPFLSPFFLVKGLCVTQNVYSCRRWTHECNQLRQEK